MRVLLGFRLYVFDPVTGRVLRRQTVWRSITNAGYEFIIRSAMDPTTRPPVASTLGIGWGTGSTTPFDRSQAALQGAYTSMKSASFVYDPVQDLLHGYLEATWGENDPSSELIVIGELGMFNAAGTMIDRTPITPTPKRPNEAIRVHGVLGFKEAETAFTLI